MRGLPPPQLAELCTCLIATVCDRVTAGHEQAGHLAVYAKDVRFCAWRWPVGEARGNKQSAITQAILTSFTFMPMPKLLAAPGSEDDWSHLFGGVAGEEGLFGGAGDLARPGRGVLGLYGNVMGDCVTAVLPHSCRQAHHRAC